MDLGTEFQPVIDDPFITDPSSVRAVACVSGKWYYELLKARQTNPDWTNNIAIVRIEELCPFPYFRLREVLERYPNANEVCWCQEEPQNCGGWYHVNERLKETMEQLGWRNLVYFGHRHSPMPAPGSTLVHKNSQALLIEGFKNLCNGETEAWPLCRA